MKVWNSRNMRAARRAALFAGVAVAAMPAMAFAAAAAEAARATALEEVVVTAQKREQNLQEVPISVSAISAETMQANRVYDVRDLNALAPNLTIRISAGGQQIPVYTLRGLVTGGSTPGSDKGVALYIDGVYVQSVLGSIFQLADIARIEVLKGPQGTLFGRNSTGGAISLTTREPTGEFGVEQGLTFGNYNQLRSKTRVDFPMLGPLSASLIYMHSEREGDTKNLGAGTKWNYGPATGNAVGVLTSPARLGDDDTDAFMLSLHMNAGDKVSLSYKFDYASDRYTPEAWGASLQNNLALLGAGGPLFTALLSTQPNPAILTPLTTTRPAAVNNWFTSPGKNANRGHSFTATWQVTDDISVKNILAYRSYTSMAADQVDGYGGLVNTVALLGPVGQPYMGVGSFTEEHGRQWSDEVVASWDTKVMHLTAGYIHFDDKVVKGIPGYADARVSLQIVPNFTLPFIASRYSKANVKSDAFYVQPEIHFTDKIDFVLGYRLTMDRKTEEYTNSALVLQPLLHTKKDKPTYLVGMNYKVNDDIFAYAKYSTGYISGGSVSGLVYTPELSKSWEAGVKADLFDRRLRSNLAVYSVEYTGLQSSARGAGIGRPDLAIVIINGADARAKGFEWENTAIPMEGLTLTADLGLTDTSLFNQNPALGLPQNTRPGYRPKWTGSGSAQYEVRDMPGGSRLVLRLDANYKSKMYLGSFNVTPNLLNALTVPPTWIVNARVALADIKVLNTTAEVALWGRNLTDEDHMAFAAAFPFYVAGSYERARTYGVDVNFKF